MPSAKDSCTKPAAVRPGCSQPGTVARTAHRHRQLRRLRRPLSSRVPLYKHVEKAHGLPESARQVPFQKADGRQGRRDRVYQEHGVIIELDGALAHPAEKGWADKDRDRAAAAEGMLSLRYGWMHVTAKPCVTAAEVASVLLHRGWTGTLNPCSPAVRPSTSLNHRQKHPYPFIVETSGTMQPFGLDLTQSRHSARGPHDRVACGQM